MEGDKMKITMPKYLTIEQANATKTVINGSGWFNSAKEVESQARESAESFCFAKGFNGSKCLMVERLEWASNYGGRENDYDSPVTVWVTAIVEFETDVIKRIGFDLLDALMISYDDPKCSGLIF
jgi:hypothetical protein